MAPHYQWILTPIVAGLGIIISALVAIFVPARMAKHQKREAARAGALVAQEALGLIIDRLAIRFDPAVLPTEGPTLREYRATAAVNALMELKLADLPPSLVPHFSRLRSGLFALNSSMSTEGKDDPEEKQTADGQPRPKKQRLARYGTVFEWLIGSYEVIRTSRFLTSGLSPLKLTEYTWQPKFSEEIPSASGVETYELPPA